MADSREPKTEGFLFFGNTHINKSSSFGRASKRINKVEAGYSFTPVGLEIKQTSGDNNFGGEATIKAELGKVEAGYSYDKSTFIPEISAKAEANLAKLSADAKVIMSGIKNDIASAEIGIVSVGAKAEAGGRKIPVALASANSIKGKASVGFGDAKLELNPGSGEGGKFGLDFSKPLNPFTSGATPSSLGDYSLGIPGYLDYDSKTNEVKGDFGSDTLNLDNALNSLKGRGGEEVGNAREIYSDKANRDQLLEAATKAHSKYAKTLNWSEGKNGLLSGRKNRNIADNSTGYISRIDDALGYLNREKGKIDQQRTANDLKPSEYDDLAKQSDSIKKEIEQLTEAKNNLSSDLGRADKNSVPENTVQKRPGTNEIVAEALNNAYDFEKGFKEKGLGDHLSDSATGICNSNDALSNRISEIDTQIAENNKDITRAENIKNSRTDAIDQNHPGIEKLNENEAKLREENKRLRDERGECQKALLETQKNFNPTEESAKFEKNGRDLKCREIDNKNAIAAKKDDIDNYCNDHDITKDKNGEYSNKQDEGLKKLLSEKNDLEKQSDSIKDAISKNDEALKDSELKGKCSLTVEADGANAKVKSSSDEYADRRSLNDEAKKSEMPAKTETSEKENKQSEMPTKTQASEKENKQSEMPTKTQASDKDNKPSEMPTKSEGVSKTEAANNNSPSEASKKSQTSGMGM